MPPVIEGTEVADSADERGRSSGPAHPAEYYNRWSNECLACPVALACSNGHDAVCALLEG